MPKTKRRGRAKKVVRRTPRCPNDNTKLKRSSSPGSYLCPKCDTLWTIAALKSHLRSVEKMKKQEAAQLAEA